MIQFFDEKGNRVELSFSRNAFGVEPKHVLVLCKLQEDWVLTRHKERGLEFPGGKREKGETLEEAARREVYEEIGAVLGDVRYLAEYKVSERNGYFVKAVFLADVKRLERTGNYHETLGPHLIKGDLLQLRFGKEFSFIMKDRVVEECIKFIENIMEY
ncbi:nucleoside triphosphatase YtkD [Neobacillus sedimentimangrovi]|jgi:8-oxo-dGTP diphosphatase|uniref:Nucleoside triphosphatase YtkD n=1 Tax=Neobacillus sedimentimangrovi TaxID=2699460 RepID=A0ABS8QLE2_9BACI|nr:nucleoside triphosphatase YtkD [Neobacillus sedimentimangrovi]AIM15984.1 7,8-dihydro-8-oxoguanine-triphosphatase [Bacillus sp. X1(2014)]MCD4839641.1 nucleoside triphosphatase YtkD [Neobacillus sedimentimangrovi]